MCVGFVPGLGVLMDILFNLMTHRRRTESTGAASTNNSTGKKPFTLPKTGDETVEKIRLGEDKGRERVCDAAAPDVLESTCTVKLLTVLF